MSILTLPNERSRFIQDLEFVQMIANMDYLIWLAKKGFLTNHLFINYLQHLRYLEDPNYAHFLLFPQSLAVLQMLLDVNVRESLIDDPERAKSILVEQFYCDWAARREISIDSST
jgi:SOH1